MSKSLKKRGLPKFSKLGKFFKLKRSSNKKKNAEKASDHEDQNGGPSTPTFEPEYTKFQSDIDEEMNENSTKDAKKSVEESLEEFEVISCPVNEELCEKNNDESLTNEDVEIDTRTKPLKHERNHNTQDKEIPIADIVIHSSLEKNPVESEKLTSPSSHENICENSDSIDNVTKTTEKLSNSKSFQSESPQFEEYPEELIYPVLIKTPFQKQKSEAEIPVEDEDKEKNDICNGHVKPIPFTVVVHTPVKKQLDCEEASFSVAASQLDDSVLMEMPQTPQPKKPEKRNSQRMLTVKKIRSIIATPYKRLKRDSSSLVDGQTYRYIEIQSLVNAFQTLHQCKGGMVACNEQGLQYGKSSVLRIECQDCNTKVFLQATKS